MYQGRTVLAVVPARSQSKGIPQKNIQKIRGIPLLGWAGLLLGKVSFVDASVVSTDSHEFAAEARRWGLDAPFLRPAHLSGDAVGDVETLQHALGESEQFYGRRFDVILMLQPTSPIRHPVDIESCVEKLVRSNADSVVTVSELDKKFHPLKPFRIVRDQLVFYHPDGPSVKGKQGLETLYFRNGVCYALTREMLMTKGNMFGTRTLGEVTKHPIANIDYPIELAWAEFLVGQDEELRGWTA